MCSVGEAPCTSLGTPVLEVLCLLKVSFYVFKLCVVFIVSVFYFIGVFYIVYFFVVIDCVFPFRDARLPFTLDLIFLLLSLLYICPLICPQRN